MSLNIKHPEADRLARLLVEKTGEKITDLVIEALRDRLLREQGRRSPVDLEEDLAAISQRCAKLPDLDCRSPEEIMGYNDSGLPR